VARAMQFYHPSVPHFLTESLHLLSAEGVLVQHPA
jgi:hypothetical protein